jgi:hypothetical protein
VRSLLGSRRYTIQLVVAQRKPWKRAEARYYPRMRDGTCRRVALDTNLVWNGSLDTLQMLRGRGFLLSICEVALTERWARAFREGNPGKLRRAQQLDALLDPGLVLRRLK